jgi:hypothetical protein
MESIEEQWNPPGPQDIMSDLWMNIKDAKQAVKIWLLDRGNPGAILVKTIRLDFSFTVSFRPAPSIFELHRRRTFLESLHILHTIALLRLIHVSNHGTQRGIWHTLLNEM